MNKKLLSSMIIVSILCVLGVFVFQNLKKPTEEVKAGSAHNVFGFAWAGVPQASGEKLGLGWISFNSANCDANNDQHSDGSPAGCPPAGTLMADYGVNIEPDGNLSGYAYFDMDDPNTPEHEVGWIDFDPSGPYPNCPSTTCPGGSPDYSAYVDISGKVTGWARALNQDGGWDGWILLGPIIKNGTDYGVYIDPATGQFHGWAWGDDVMGWISFNCDNPESGNVCTQSDYKVYTTFSFNSPPEVQNRHISSENYCVAEQTGRIVFEWTYSDPDSDPETRFDFRINDTNNVNDPNPEVDRTISGLNNPSPTTNNQSVFVVSSPQPDKLQYNKTYYWWVRVWDSQGNNSDWQYGGSFTTKPHAYPYVSFSWNPEEPAVEEVVLFINQSKCYDNFNNEVNCSSYLWTIPPTAEFTNGTDQTSKDPQVIFHETGEDIPITLRVTDASGYSCEKTINIQINAPLPGWIEVPPR
ncbi:hypothetical protein J7J74_00935 [bacterium]|nr:hypothetical protein [bacterium]